MLGLRCLLRQFKWDELKNEWLKVNRGISFEEITQAKHIATVGHKLRSNQQVMLFEYKNYVWAAPCIVTNEGETLLKTLYPSRKYTKMIRKGQLP